MKINNSDLLKFENHPSTNQGGRSGGAQNRTFADALRPAGSPAETPAADQRSSIRESAAAEGPTPLSTARPARRADPSSAGQRADAPLEAARSLIRSRLGEGLQQHALAQNLIDEVGQMVLNDPVLSRNLTSLPRPKI